MSGEAKIEPELSKGLKKLCEDLSAGRMKSHLGGREVQSRGCDEFEYDGWKRKLGSRNFLRKKLNLLSDCAPGIMPEFSNGFSISFLGTPKS